MPFLGLHLLVCFLGRHFYPLWLDVFWFLRLRETRRHSGQSLLLTSRVWNKAGSKKDCLWGPTAPLLWRQCLPVGFPASSPRGVAMGSAPNAEIVWLSWVGPMHLTNSTCLSCPHTCGTFACALSFSMCLLPELVAPSSAFPSLSDKPYRLIGLLGTWGNNEKWLKKYQDIFRTLPHSSWVWEGHSLLDHGIYPALQNYCWGLAIMLAPEDLVSSTGIGIIRSHIKTKQVNLWPQFYSEFL